MRDLTPRPLNRTTTQILARTAAAAALAAGLAACGGGDDAAARSRATALSSHGPAATGSYNGSDVSFAADMIPHHAQAVEMATMALEKASNAQVRQLAAAIQAAQDPEIKTMSGWLAGWGEEVPSADSSDGAGGGHGGGHGSNATAMGMMSADQMRELRAATGAAFDRLWVEMMIEHHEGAVQMAKAELAEGQNAEAKALAELIVAAQTREIASMRALAKSLV